jgi:pyridoxal phosphate enzyme (YggS family)
MNFTMLNSSVFDNFQRVLDRIETATISVHQNQDRVRLIVVTKGHPLEIVQEVIAAGAKHLGENYVEEALAKIASVENAGDLKWHMIGHVQSRKARRVCEHFDWVQTIDSLRLATRLDRFAGEMGKRVPILLECNVSGEETKFGWIAWNELEWEELAEEIEPILEMRNLEVCGLMTMAPFFPDAEQARPYFTRLRKLRDFLNARFPQSNWAELSMGMSGDYEVAIQEGATIVRIGTAILGERK